MKKKWCFLLSIVIIIFIILLLIKCVFYNSEELKGEYIVDTHISIIGENVFFEDSKGILTKSRNLNTGEEKIAGIGMYNVAAHNDELYYFAQRSVNPESYFCKRGINSLIEKRVTPNKVSSYKFYKNYLYFQKHSHSTDFDGKENGYIYRMNTDTKQVENIISLRARGFAIINDTLYYIRLSEEGYKQYGELLSDGIYSYSLTDKTETKVIEGWVGDFYVSKNTIVYSVYNSRVNGRNEEAKYSLLWLNNDTNKTMQISDDVNEFRLYDENLCFTENSIQDKIHIFNCSTEKKTSITVKGIDDNYGFVLHNNRVYYYDKKHTFCYKALM